MRFAGKLGDSVETTTITKNAKKPAPGGLSYACQEGDKATSDVAQEEENKNRATTGPRQAEPHRSVEVE
ncbi:hypothetical protein GNH96_11270 [Methylococcus geothermalis]|uniref:Uncharacterized protein n=1 Tax=Methylococcus geothermalis TaxID=2681310 RepID=A0A858Q9H0_9GAMM|nr:hypothetical protein GNH96_11270 [Methylococcus geothermalis]